MRIAFVLFDQLTALDFVSIYDPLTRLRSMGFLPELEWELCAPAAEIVDDRGMRFLTTRVGGDLEEYDLMIVPGGFVTRQLIHDAAFLEWLRTAATVPMKASVCTGGLLLGAAGFLQGKRATTHPSAYHLLRPYCAAVIEDQRVVDAGDIITARGVTAGLDLGLHLVERLAGSDAREKIRKQMDYPG